MKIELWTIGKTTETYLQVGIEIYLQRLKHYIPFEMIVLPEAKNAGKLSSDQLKIKEGDMILHRLREEELLILLDERGKSYTSEAFARFLEQKMQLAGKKMIFVIGGAWGFSPAVYARAHAQVSLSSMTFSHQMARLFFVEQLYRAMTILRNEPYHNA